MSSTSEPTATATDASDPAAPGAPTALPGGRTLFARPGADKPAAPDARAQARRHHLQAHAERAQARREALLALLRSSALGELVRVDPQLQRDVAKLMAFVMDDLAPPL
jgi:hypothetical protein